MSKIPIANKIDKRKGAIAALLFMLAMAVYVGLISFQIADPPPQPVLVEVETHIDEIYLKNLTVDGGSSSGSPSEAPVEQPKPQTQQGITTEESETEENTGQSNHTTTASSDNTNSTTQTSNDPFASGGNSNGENGGSGNTFGSDGTGTEGDGGGSGSGKGRIRKNDPILTDLKSNVNAYIYLKLTIDAQGNVVSASNIKAQTTTSNQILINKVIYHVKKQVKYNKDEGAPVAKVFMTVKVDAE